MTMCLGKPPPPKTKTKIQRCKTTSRGSTKLSAWHCAILQRTEHTNILLACARKTDLMTTQTVDAPIKWSSGCLLCKRRSLRCLHACVCVCVVSFITIYVLCNHVWSMRLSRCISHNCSQPTPNTTHTVFRSTFSFLTSWFWGCEKCNTFSGVSKSPVMGNQRASGKFMRPLHGQRQIAWIYCNCIWPFHGCDQMFQDDIPLSHSSTDTRGMHHMAQSHAWNKPVPAIKQSIKWVSSLTSLFASCTLVNDGDVAMALITLKWRGLSFGLKFL